MLENKLDRFKEYKEGGRKRTKQRLLKIIDDYIENETIKTNRQKKSQAFTQKLAPGGRGLVGTGDKDKEKKEKRQRNRNGKPNENERGRSGNPSDGKSMPSALVVKSQAVCQNFLKGTCKYTRQECFYSHPEGYEGIGIVSGKGRGKDGKGKTPRTPLTKEEKAKTFCFHFGKGSCKNGEKCEYSHDPKHKKRSRDGKGKGKRSGSKGSQSSNKGSRKGSGGSKGGSRNRTRSGSRTKSRSTSRDSKGNKKPKRALAGTVSEAEMSGDGKSKSARRRARKKEKAANGGR